MALNNPKKRNPWNVIPTQNRDFPFNFKNGVPARCDILFEALQYTSSPSIPRFHLIVKNFPAGSESHVAINTRKVTARGAVREIKNQKQIEDSACAKLVLHTLHGCIISISLCSYKMMIWWIKFLGLRHPVTMYMTVYFMVIDTQDICAARKHTFPVISRGL